MSIPDAPATNHRIEATVTHLVRQSGITEGEARQLVAMLGLDLPSLLREATEIKMRRSSTLFEARIR
jgi:hypothetical protein